MKKIFSVFLACVLIWALRVESASALNVSITGGSAIDTTNGYYRTVLSAGDSFSVTFTASGNQGEVTWSMNVQDNTASNISNNYNAVGVSATNVSMSNTSGLSTTISGVLDSETTHCDVYVYATDSSGEQAYAPTSPFVCIENSAYSNMLNGGTSVPYGQSDSGNNYSQTEVPLPYGYVRPISATTLQEGVLEKIAESENIDISEIKFLTSENISEAYEPTDTMKQEASDEGLEYAAKLNTINFPEKGYYLFEVDFPSELQGLDINDLRLQFVDTEKVNGSAKTAIVDIVNSFCSGIELKGMLGETLETVPGRALLIVLTSAGRSFTMYALKILLALLGGCNVGGIASYYGFGLAGLLGLGGTLVIRKFFRKN